MTRDCIKMNRQKTLAHRTTTTLVLPKPTMDTAGIQDFFAGKSVLLTGVTGLVGKLVLEKLLRSCERLDTVYVVIRPKKDKGCEQRLKELCELQVSMEARRKGDRLGCAGFRGAQRETARIRKEDSRRRGGFREGRFQSEGARPADASAEG